MTAPPPAAPARTPYAALAASLLALGLFVGGTAVMLVRSPGPERGGTAPTGRDPNDPAAKVPVTRAMPTAGAN